MTTAIEHTFEYGATKVSDLQVRTNEIRRAGVPQVAAVEMDGQLLDPSRRFWTSFFHRFGVAEKTFRYFSHAEVFARIAEKAPSESFRYCIERNGKGHGRLLAVTSPDKRPLDVQAVGGLLTDHGAEDVQYQDGRITSRHVPRSGEGTFRIGGDGFENRYVMETPVDGYGVPKIHLSLLRQVCSNGAVGYTRAFRSEISVGKDVVPNLARALETFDNGDGYAALRNRFESAQTSWASIRESQKLYRTLTKLRDAGDTPKSGILRDFYAVTGRVQEVYGLANLDALNAKRQRVLPTGCKVYDLLNFASEVATHHANANGARLLQAYIGDLVSDEFDMEGTAKGVTDFQDFFVQTPTAGPLVGRN